MLHLLLIRLKPPAGEVSHQQTQHTKYYIIKLDNTNGTFHIQDFGLRFLLISYLTYYINLVKKWAKRMRTFLTAAAAELCPFCNLMSSIPSNFNPLLFFFLFPPWKPSTMELLSLLLVSKLFSLDAKLPVEIDASMYLKSSHSSILRKLLSCH